LDSRLETIWRNAGPPPEGGTSLFHIGVIAIDLVPDFLDRLPTRRRAQMSNFTHPRQPDTALLVEVMRLVEPQPQLLVRLGIP